LPAAAPLIVTVAVTVCAPTLDPSKVPLVAVQFNVSPDKTPVREQLMFAFGSVAVPSYVLFCAVRVAAIGLVFTVSVVLASVALLKLVSA
jgi:hypothetical protein